MKEVLRYMDNIGLVVDPVDRIPKQLSQISAEAEGQNLPCYVILLALFASVVIVTVPATNFFNEAMETIDLQNKLLTVEDANRYWITTDRLRRVILTLQVQSLVRTNNESF